jgi:8-oxo-dGTP diphosphatase
MVLYGRLYKKSNKKEYNFTHPRRKLMLEVKFYETVEDHLLEFAVIVAKKGEQWVFCKQKTRDTYEVPGGHREQGETILEAAKRELFEETGAVDFEITPVCVYSVKGNDGAIDNVKETFGMLFYATINRFEQLPEYEMEETILMDCFPQKWTYPLIQPKLMAKIVEEVL